MERIKVWTEHNRLFIDVDYLGVRPHFIEFEESIISIHPYKDSVFVECEKEKFSVLDIHDLSVTKVDKQMNTMTDVITWEDAKCDPRHIRHLIEDNKRLRETLRWYGELPCIQEDQVGWNVGFVARQALRKDEKE